MKFFYLVVKPNQYKINESSFHAPSVYFSRVLENFNLNRRLKASIA